MVQSVEKFTQKVGAKCCVQSINQSINLLFAPRIVSFLRVVFIVFSLGIKNGAICFTVETCFDVLAAYLAVSTRI